MRILRARLLAAAQEEADKEASDATAQPGPDRRPVRAGADLQLPGEPHLRPSGELQGAQPRPGARRRPRRRRPGPRRRRHRGQARGRRASDAAARATSLRDAVAAAAARLAAAGVESARYDAEELAAHSLRGRARATCGAHDARRRRQFLSYVERRAAREPLQHITGTAYFRHLAVAVGPGVFVPRPETELVAEAAIDSCPAARAAPVVVDLCTGSGAIALAVADEVAGAPGARGRGRPGGLPVGAAQLRGHRGRAPSRRHGGRLPRAGRDGRRRRRATRRTSRSVRRSATPRSPPTTRRWRSGREPTGSTRCASSSRWRPRLLRRGGTVVAEHADLQGRTAPAVFARTGRWADVADHRDLAEAAYRYLPPGARAR